jgi:universal stress protein E
MSASSTILAVLAADAIRSPALYRAFELARRASAPLHLLCLASAAEVDAVLVQEESNEPEHAHQRFEAEFGIALGVLAHELAAEGLRLSTEVVCTGAQHQAVLASVAGCGAGLVVKDVHRESGLRRLLMTPLDQQLLRQMPGELMLVAAGSAASPRRVLAAVDVLEPDQDAECLNLRIVQRARELADAPEAELHLVSVFAAPRGCAADSISADALARHAETFGRFADACAVPAHCRHRLIGIPGQQLTDLAQQRGVDLLVLGNHYRNALQRMLLGSTAEAVLEHAACDLLMVRNPRH